MGWGCLGTLKCKLQVVSDLGQDEDGGVCTEIQNQISPPDVSGPGRGPY